MFLNLNVFEPLVKMRANYDIPKDSFAEEYKTDQKQNKTKKNKTTTKDGNHPKAFA